MSSKRTGFGMAISKFANAIDMNHGEFAALIGSDDAQMSRMVCGHRVMDRETIDRILAIEGAPRSLWLEWLRETGAFGLSKEHSLLRYDLAERALRYIGSDTDMTGDIYPDMDGFLRKKGYDPLLI